MPSLPGRVSLSEANRQRDEDIIEDLDDFESPTLPNKPTEEVPIKEIINPITTLSIKTDTLKTPVVMNKSSSRPPSIQYNSKITMPQRVPLHQFLKALQEVTPQRPDFNNSLASPAFKPIDEETPASKSTILTPAPDNIKSVPFDSTFSFNHSSDYSIFTKDHKTEDEYFKKPFPKTKASPKKLFLENDSFYNKNFEDISLSSFSPMKRDVYDSFYHVSNRSSTAASINNTSNNMCASNTFKNTFYNSNDFLSNKTALRSETLFYNTTSKSNQPIISSSLFTPSQQSHPSFIQPMPTHASTSKSSLYESPLSSSSCEDQENSTCLTINGCKYKIHEEIGKGGFSRVYRASSRSLEDCAIKCMNLKDADSCTISEYLNEVEILKKLKGSVHVIYLYSYYYDKPSNCMYLVMERGKKTLKSFFAEESSDDPDKQLNLIKKCWKDILEAVMVIHDNDVIHWDLKPDNFVWCGRRLKVIDFGISKQVLPDHTSATYAQIIGTYDFMSPEALTNLGDEELRVKAHKKSDVWSLGCILYRMVYGQGPFKKIHDPIQKLIAIRSASHQIPYPFTPLGPVIIDTIKKCLQRESAVRPTVKELLYEDQLLRDFDDHL